MLLCHFKGNRIWVFLHLGTIQIMYMHTHFCKRNIVESTLFSLARHSVEFLEKECKKEYKRNGKE